MIVQAFIMTAALALWGWQTGLLPAAVVMALVLAGSRAAKVRWALSDRDFSRISDLCLVLLAGTALYITLSDTTQRSFLAVIQRLPLVFFPLTASQRYSTSERINVRCLMPFRRRRIGRPVYIDLQAPYIALCVLCAGAANVRTPVFYAALVLIAGGLLWSIRPRRTSVTLWVFLMTAAVAGGYAGQLGLTRLQEEMRRWAIEWFAEMMQRDMNSYRARTAIGKTGGVRLSSRILFRLKAEEGTQVPLRLRKACYNIYNTSVWYASHPDFKVMIADPGGLNWQLSPQEGSERGLTLSYRLGRGKGMLVMPKGAARVENLPALMMARNKYGAIRVEEAPGFVNYRVEYNPLRCLGGAPNRVDLVVPGEEAAEFYRLAADLALDPSEPRAALEKVAGFFKRGFSYTLDLDAPAPGTGPLTDFLQRTRSGHCEYFATATVMLLRSAGIPARYVAGYLVQEYSGLEGRFVVRSSDAHAWATAYVDGSWYDIDTTPAAPNLPRGSILRSVYNVFSWGLFKFTEWRWSGEESALKPFIPWLLIPLAVILARNILLGRRVGSTGKKKRRAEKKIAAGADSEFYHIEKKLKDLGHERRPGETLGGWIQRIERERPGAVPTQALYPILTLHYRYRFDPRGLDADQRQALREGARSWLDEQKSPTGKRTEC